MSHRERTTPRVRTSICAEFKGSRLKGRGRIKNVGEGGLFVQTAAIPEQGDFVRVRFSQPMLGHLEVSGMVWWTTGRRHHTPGFGLRVLNADAPYRDLVTQLLRR
jgi:hypothetical protein